jgi:hypothetical protein
MKFGNKKTRVSEVCAGYCGDLNSGGSWNHSLTSPARAQQQAQHMTGKVKE